MDENSNGSWIAERVPYVDVQPWRCGAFSWATCANGGASVGLQAVIRQALAKTLVFGGLSSFQALEAGVPGLTERIIYGLWREPQRLDWAE